MVSTIYSALGSDQKQQFSVIFGELSKVLGITRKQYEAAVRSYEFVGDWLSDNSPLSLYRPQIWPQGSFLLGTMIGPFRKEELDLDLVCRLLDKPPLWTQYHLKEAIGNRLKDHGTLRSLLVLPDGRRCWTLDYHEGSKFHMDVLPALVTEDFNTLLEKARLSSNSSDVEKLGIHITDKTLLNFKTEINPARWLLVNPFGYAIWFYDRASLDTVKSLSARNSVKPVPDYDAEKLPLQQIVQLLKRHRDIMFNGDDKKPISIIVTTLIAKAYRKERNVADSLINIVDRMEDEIEERYSTKHGRVIRWISNPVNAAENFADKWAEDDQKEKNFYRWLSALRADLGNIFRQTGLSDIQRAMSSPFGHKEATSAIGNLGETFRMNRELGNLSVLSTGIQISNEGQQVIDHVFHGK